jgi:hypothetical protein
VSVKVEGVFVFRHQCCVIGEDERISDRGLRSESEDSESENN